MPTNNENDGTPFVRVDGYEQADFANPLLPAYMRDVEVHRIDEHGMRHLIGKSPNFDLLRQITSDKMSQQLYRVSHRDSGGRSSRGNFQSAYAEKRAFSSQRRFESKGYHFYSSFISFTDSWVFVIWLALRLRAANCKDIKIHIVDTYTITNPKFIAHSYSIAKAYKVGEGRAETFYKRMMGATHTEFLVWNEIQVQIADEVELEAILGADHNETIRILKSFNWPVPNPTRKGKDYEETTKRFEKKLYKDETEVEWRKQDAYQGVKGMKWLNPRVYSGAMKQAHPPMYCKYNEIRRGLDIPQFEAAKKIARCFKAPFQLDVLIAHLSTLTKTIAFDSIIESLIRCNEVREMALGYRYYPACQKTNRPKEVKVHQQMFRTFAKYRGIQIIESLNQPLRNLIRIENSGHPRKPRMFNKLNKPYTGFKITKANAKVFSQPMRDDLDKQPGELNVSEHSENEVRETTSHRSLEESLLEELGAESDSEPPHKRMKLNSLAPQPKIPPLKFKNPLAARNKQSIADEPNTKLQQRPIMLKLNCQPRPNLQTYSSPNPQSFEEMDKLSRILDAGNMPVEGILIRPEDGPEVHREREEV